MSGRTNVMFGDGEVKSPPTTTPTSPNGSAVSGSQTESAYTGPFVPPWIAAQSTLLPGIALPFQSPIARLAPAPPRAVKLPPTTIDAAFPPPGSVYVVIAFTGPSAPPRSNHSNRWNCGMNRQAAM